MVPTTRNPSVAPPNRRRGDTYKVRSGDSLWTIARAHKTSIAQLRRANRIGRDEPIRIGQRIEIPGTGRSVHRTIRYKVRKGDSLARIAGKFGISVSAITDMNQLNQSAYIHPGQRLRLRVPVAGR